VTRTPTAPPRGAALGTPRALIRTTVQEIRDEELRELEAGVEPRDLESEMEELRRESERGEVERTRREEISREARREEVEDPRTLEEFTRHMEELALDADEGHDDGTGHPEEAGMEEHSDRARLEPREDPREAGSRRTSVSSTSSHHSAMKAFFRAQTKTLEQLSEKVAKSGKGSTKEKIKSPESYDGKYELFYNILDKIAEMENYFSQHGTDPVKWIGITNTYLTHKAKTIVTSSPFATGHGTWQEYTDYLTRYLLPRQHEDNLRAYRAQLTQLSTLTQYAELWDKLWTAFVRAGIQPDESQWLWDIRRGLAREEDRRVIMLAMCTEVREMTGLIRLLDESAARKGGRKDDGGRSKRRDQQNFPRKDRDGTREGHEGRKDRKVFTVRESDSELEEEEDDDDSEEERVAIVITNLEKRELGPMTRDLRELRKRKGLCMFCGAHSQKEGQKCPNYERLRLASVRTNGDGSNTRKGPSKSRKGDARSGGKRKEKNFSVRQSDSSTEPEEEEESEEEVSAVNVRRTARSRSMSASRSEKRKNP